MKKKNPSSTDKMTDYNIEFTSYTVACNLQPSAARSKFLAQIISRRLNVLKGVKKMPSILRNSISG